MIAMEEIRTALNCHHPQLLEQQLDRRAAVALLLRPAANGAEMLFIQRASHPLDPWSGNLGFPGGSIEEEDKNSLSAAIRETSEEVGLSLSQEHLVGRLDDLHGIRIPVQVSCYVFIVNALQQVYCNEEVEHSFWWPVTKLQEQQRHGIHQVDWHGNMLDVPGIVIADNLPLLWGLTYRFVSQFLTLVGTKPLPLL
ncbi:MAG: hypothetical protein B6I36_06875 [Desulfobacteraceae bacterium 4572_35.1]|nr:MAG: hypothetical protein B6I36_06875 [Desulfobacteraceae bacterium 4572_35.1]